MVVVGLPYSFSGLTELGEITGGTPYGATTIAGLDGGRQPSKNELEGGPLPRSPCGRDCQQDLRLDRSLK